MEVLKIVISWLHIFTAGVSLFLGAFILFKKKGTSFHKKAGIYYFYLMLVNNLTSLFIYKATGKWFFPHTLAIVTIIVLLPGYLITFKKAYKHWLKIHIISMVISYYLLIGGAINEAFLHIDILRPYLINNAPVVGITHFISQTIFIILLVYFLKTKK